MARRFLSFVDFTGSALGFALHLPIYQPSHSNGNSPAETPIEAPRRISTESPAPRYERTPQEVIAWAFARFAGRKMVITTAFGMEGCVMVDMVAELGVRAEISYLDTHFLFPETLELKDRLAERYPHLAFVNRGTSMTPEEQEVSFGPNLWKRDPDRCCRLRKLDPMRTLLRDADAWMTAVRREQSPERATMESIGWDRGYEVVKVSPIVKWTREEVYEYVRARDVPISTLHERGYPTFGCTHCTLPVAGARPSDYSRAGRWVGMEKSECGLHVDPVTGCLSRAGESATQAAPPPVVGTDSEPDNKRAAP
jgi:phosphoadenosine phosphosulfate reductase